MADSPRWCARCQRYGDHHTDRHDKGGEAHNRPRFTAEIELQARLQAAEEENERLREALRFYADEKNYDGWAPVECRVADDGEDGGCEYDGGRLARAALRPEGDG